MDHTAVVLCACVCFEGVTTFILFYVIVCWSACLSLFLAFLSMDLLPPLSYNREAATEHTHVS